MDRTGQVRARLALLDALAQHDLHQVASRYRAERVQALAVATLKKARRGTPQIHAVFPRIRRVMTGPTDL